MQHHTIQRLKRKLNQTKPDCCFTGLELLLLRSLFPRQDYIIKERVMITCALPVRLIELAKSLVHSGQIESTSFLFRLCLMNYQRTNWLPPLSHLSLWSNPKSRLFFSDRKRDFASL